MCVKEFVMCEYEEQGLRQGGRDGWRKGYERRVSKEIEQEENHGEKLEQVKK